MNKRLYVGGLTADLTEAALQEAFAQAGAVESVKIIMNRDTGESKEFGFVEMVTEEDAQKAIEMWNEKELNGKKLTVNEARPPADRN